MTYNPSIPGATDIIAASQADIQTNFSQANTQFSVNHEPLTTVSAQAGYHTKIFFPTGLGGDPGLVAPENSFYAKLVTGVAQLFFQNGALAANAKQLTGLVVTVGANGGTAGGTLNTLDTPWGFRLYFGLTGQLGGASSKTITFPTAFSTVYPCWVSVRDSNPNYASGIETISGMTVISQDDVKVNWFCFGVL